MSDMGPGGMPPTDRPWGGTSPTDPLGTAYAEPTVAEPTLAQPTYAEPTPRTAETAKDQAARLTQDAKESGRQVAGTAVDQGRNVADETRRQVQDLTRDVGRQVDEQSRAQKEKASAGLRSLADELSGMASYGGDGSVATDLALQASDRARDLATWLDDREPGALVEEVRSFARRKPGTFLLGALAAGAVAGRLTRGAVDTARSDDAGDEPVTTTSATPLADDLAREPEYSTTSVRGY